MLCETLHVQKLKERWQMELPTKENQKEQTYTLGRKPGQLLCSRRNKVNLLGSIKAFSIDPLVCWAAYFILLCRRVRRQPWTCSTGEIVIYFPHFSVVRAVKRRNLLLHALNFSREQTKYQADLQPGPSN